MDYLHYTTEQIVYVFYMVTYDEKKEEKDTASSKNSSSPD